jgi:glycosyltransferase involved in cell wall biosynthesis
VGVLRDRWTAPAPPGVRMRRHLTWWKTAAYIRRLTTRVAHATTVSELERSHLVDLGCRADRVTVVPNGVDESDLTFDRAPRADTLVYAGSPTFAPNLDAMRFFLDAILPLVRRARPGVILRITGEVDD